MNRLIFKMIVFAILLSAVVAGNSYVINGPLLEHNSNLALKQFDGVPATNRDFQVNGYSIPFNVVYTGEILALALAFTVLFGKEVISLFFVRSEPTSPKE